MSFRKYLRLAIGLALALNTLAVLAASNHDPIKIGWNGEPGNHIVVRTAQRILEKRLGYNVDIVQTSNGLQWQGVAQGDMDAMLVAWLPTTQAAYWKKFKNDVVDLGVMFTGKIGWVVPDYIPKDKLKSIPDLRDPEAREKLGARIVGIQPGAGIMDRSEKALEAYDLDEYTLTTSSTAGMTAALKRAHDRKDWIVVTGWSPLHIFAKWNLRYLEDPKGVFGVTQKIHAIGRQGIRKDMPRAAVFLSQYRIPVSTLEEALLRYNETDVEAAVSGLLESKPELAKEWVKKAEREPRYSE